jgi:hypothetical protein
MPGGPIMSRLWEPAALSSWARFIQYCHYSQFAVWSAAQYMAKRLNP